ncbi:Alpha/Beta hydrolase protein [Stachybotrys elegans]|uniref:Alpha/Beta hydrolase protein n=1 Tax=Stachybotrys elegans TaxID=80388 RepID=A0A8K0SBV4_9HYPO|nr:Alpha/Beta hydrolase protein [Stachybotrys elegans]
MVSLTARVVRFYVEWIRRSKDYYGDTSKMREHIQTLHMRPQSFSPPQNLGPDIKIERVDIQDWPLYRISCWPSSGVQDAANHPAMLYCHGGAFVHEIQSMHYKFLAQIARDTGLDILVPIYPLVPRPTATAEQVIAGLHEIMTQVKQPIVSIAGDSAGGTLAILVAQHLVRIKSDLASRVRSLVLISPLLDCTISHPETKTLEVNDPWLSPEGLRMAADLFKGACALSNPRISPLFGDIADLPPTMLLCGTHDLLCIDARRLSARFRNGGSFGNTDAWMAGSVELERFTYVEAEEMIHVWPILPSAEGAEARRTIMGFLRKHM